MRYKMTTMFNLNRLTVALSFVCALFFVGVQAQEKEDLFDLLADEGLNEQPLLPERMLFTQRAFWGENGLFRKTKLVPLTLENREKELKLRRTMLTTHQVIGYLTLAGMVAQGIIGGKLYNGDGSLYQTHKTMGKLVTISYFTGAGLSLFAPPPLTNKKQKGLSSARAHKWLATVHFSAMVATNILSDQDKQLHKVAAYTAFASYATAVLVFTF